MIKELLSQYNTVIVDYKILPDEPEQIKQQLLEWVRQDIPFLFTTGGTGLGPRDTTVETVKSIIEKEAEGISEAMHYTRTNAYTTGHDVAFDCRHYRANINCNLTLSSSGAKESLEAILPAVFHARKCCSAKIIHPNKFYAFH